MSDTTTLQSPKKLFTILEYVIESGGAGVTEVATETGLAKSTVHLHLQTLTDLGHVVRRDNGYHPSLQLFEWGERIRNGIEAYRRGREEVDSLAERTAELVNFGIVENSTVRLVYLRQGEEAQHRSSDASVSTEFTSDAPNVRTISENYQHALGEELPMHATAMGKAILAELPDSSVSEIIERSGLHPYTKNTISSRDELFDELEKVRSQGFAEDDEERAEGVRCIGSSICQGKEPVAALSVSVRAERLQGEYKVEIARKVIDTSNMIEIELLYQ